MTVLTLEQIEVEAAQDGEAFYHGLKIEWSNLRMNFVYYWYDTPINRQAAEHAVNICNIPESSTKEPKS